MTDAKLSEPPRTLGGHGPPRPGPIRWLGYAFGAGLPRRFDDWVYLDVTGRSWVLRQVSRGLIQLAPLVVAVLVFVPGPFWIRAVAVVAATAMGLLFCLAYMIETTDHRLVNAGFPSGTAEAARQRRSAQQRTTQTYARRERIAQRQAKRRERAAVR